MAGEITSSWGQVGATALSSAAMLLVIIAMVRLVGLRSFSKMSSFDFAVTVATGSVLGTVALTGSSLTNGITAIGTMLGLQAVIAFGRRRWRLSTVVDNRPLLLMVGSEMLADNLRQARVTADDLRAKLRAANVASYDEVRYVVLETTGDISVVTGAGPIDADLLTDVVDGGLVAQEGNPEPPRSGVSEDSHGLTRGGPAP